MKEKLVWIGAGLVILGGLVAGYFVLNSDDTNNNNEANNAPVSTVEQQDSVNIDEASIRELIANGDDLNCSYSYSEDGTNFDAQVYVSGERMSGEFTSDESSEFANAGIIYTQDTVYIWDKDTNEGFSYDTSQFDSQDQSDEGNISDSPVTLDESYDVSCERWNVDESVFEAPSDVEFTNFSELFDGLSESIEGLDTSN